MGSRGFGGMLSPVGHGHQVTTARLTATGSLWCEAARPLGAQGHQGTTPLRLQPPRPWGTRSPRNQAEKGPGHRGTKPPEDQASRSPGDQATRAQRHQQTRLPGYQTTRPPGEQATRAQSHHGSPGDLQPCSATGQSVPGCPCQSGDVGPDRP